MGEDATVAMTIERDIMVPARDGIGLASDVYRPQGRLRGELATSHPCDADGHAP